MSSDWTAPASAIRPVRALVGLLTLVGILACGARTPDLDRLYEPYSEAVEKNPVIVIPGVMGSRLFHGRTGTEIWPSGLFGMATGSHFDSLALPVAHVDVHRNRDALEARGSSTRPSDATSTPTSSRRWKAPAPTTALRRRKPGRERTASSSPGTGAATSPRRPPHSTTSSGRSGGSEEIRT